MRLSGQRRRPLIPTFSPHGGEKEENASPPVPEPYLSGAQPYLAGTGRVLYL
jgi:hypothetical protein